MEQIGRGAFGLVHKDIFNNIPVAIKTITPDLLDNGIEESAIKELRMYHIFRNCPNIIQLISFNIKEDSKVELIFPLFDTDLQKYTEQTSFLDRLNNFSIINTQLFNALHQLNERGVIHGDIKPNNILLNNNLEVCLADFGNSIQLPCNKNYRNQKLGGDLYAKGYNPPELSNFNTIIGNKLDIWALGITFLYYLIGKHFDNKYDELSNILKGSPDGYLNVMKILKNNMSEFHYNLIPLENFSLLNKMLIINPDKRISIKDIIFNVNVCKFRDVKLKRSRPLNIDLENYYLLIKYMIEVCKEFKLKIRTIILSIDLFDRLSSNHFIDDYKINIFGCIIISCKLNEIYYPEFADYVFIGENTITEDQLAVIEQDILYKMGYNTISCEIDEFVNRLEQYNYTTAIIKLEDLYNKISQNKVFASNLSYPLIMEYL